MANTAQYSVQKHYDNVLSRVYTWYAAGGPTSADFDKRCSEYAAYFESVGALPPKAPNSFAVDLGCGSGLQTIPLAKAGYSVLSVDLCKNLLNELNKNSERLALPHIKPVLDDILDFQKYLQPGISPNLVVCMVDTILHLESKQHIQQLFKCVFQSLAPGGKFIISFRNMTSAFELRDAARFLPVCSGENTIFTCFLEYLDNRVKVHDLVHLREPGCPWQQHVSCYYKLRMAPEEVLEMLQHEGFVQQKQESIRGMIHLVLEKR